MERNGEDKIIMPGFDLDFEVVCERCQSPLETDTKTHAYYGTRSVIVVPCSSCIEKETDEVRSELNDKITELQDEIEGLRRELFENGDA